SKRQEKNSTSRQRNGLALERSRKKIQRTRQTETNTLDEMRKTAYNSTFAIGGGSCSADSLVVAESFVLRINICGRNPAHRKSANCYMQVLQNVTSMKFKLKILILTFLFLGMKSYAQDLNREDLISQLKADKESLFV